MNKIVLAIVVLLIIASGAFIVFGGDDTNDSSLESSSNDSSESQSIASSELEESSIVDEKSSAKDVEKSSKGFIEYSDESLVSAADSKRILFFHAEWCSTCKFFEKQITSTEIPSDVTILKVDYDTETELKEKYGVNVQSTFVLIDESGEVVESWPFASGLRSIQDLYLAV